MVENALWTPDQTFIEQSNLHHFMGWLADKEGLKFDEYDDLWQWSVDKYEDFWRLLFDYFSIQYDGDISRATEGTAMPGIEWFPDVSLNYAEQIFERYTDEYPAILHKTETSELATVSWAELKEDVAAFQLYLKDQGIEKGDRVVAFISNIKEATVAFLATISLGAVWSSCSPDFGTESVIDRFAQIKPKILIAVNGYHYNGKAYEKVEVVESIIQKLPELEGVVLVSQLKDVSFHAASVPSEHYNSIMTKYRNKSTLSFERVNFNDPIWVLYSSGTTGNPKAITHSHGGVLLEHLKYLAFHNDVKAGERFFWYSTTGWMMWNFVHASLLAGATIVLYDGSAAYPNLNAMWALAEQAGINHFGTSAPFLVACMKQELQPSIEFDLSSMRSIGSTGSPLPPEAFEWVYKAVKNDVWLCSMCGGTDVCTAFIGGCPVFPVYDGRIQCRTLGCALFSWDDEGGHETGRVGEMVISLPMPSMPVYFWNDVNFERYLSSYFEQYPGIWRHGDWVEIKDDGSLIIYGRSDATLNRHGVRIGTSEIYRALNKVKAIKDALIVNLELSGGRHYMPLFVLLKSSYSLDEDLKREIAQMLRKTYSPRHVPDEIVEVADIPFTISGKKMEAPVKKLLLGYPIEKSVNKGACKNPESIDFFVEFAKGIKK